MIEQLLFPIDYIVLTICVLIILFSFWKGIIASILGLLTWIGSILITIYFYTDISFFLKNQLSKIDLFKNFDQITNIISIIISIPAIFLITLFILKKIRKLITSDIDKQILGIFIDKVFGFLFGFILSYIFLSTIIYCTNIFEFLLYFNKWLINNSYIMLNLEEFNKSILDIIFNSSKIN
tara:strand:- start:153 stop:692 length:540 start_codon:yes stop_codon:yes gene_type:complete